MPYFSDSIPQVLKHFDSHKVKGLTSGEVKQRQKDFGPNIFLSHKKKNSGLRLFFRQFGDTLMILLMSAGAISGLLGEYIDMTVIGITALFNVCIGFFQERKADQALERLRDMVSYRALVIRDGLAQQVDTATLVPGDIMIIEAGDNIQADARLLSVTELMINEARLTGESDAIEKHTRAVPAHTPLGDRKNMIYRGTVATHGRGTAIVTAIGSQTEMGAIANLVAETTDEQTPLQIQLGKMSRIIGHIVVVISIGIFSIGYIVRADSVTELFKTSIAVAVAAIPEGLVISLTIILAVGMRFVLKKNALVRKLVAAETLGSVSVICTDKTGTLTEGNMSVTRLVTKETDLEIRQLLVATNKAKQEYSTVVHMIRASVVANNGVLENPNEPEASWKCAGDTTDTAIIRMGMNLGIAKHELDHTLVSLGEIPFSSELKFMAKKVRADEGSILYTKGAPEIIMNRSSHIASGTTHTPFTPALRIAMEQKHTDLTEAGLRVIGVAYKVMKDENAISTDDMADLVFLGFLALTDPLRPDVKETLAIARKAGIRTIMITGDHARTARTIATLIGLPANKEDIVEGHTLEKATTQEFDALVMRASVFARVDPVHKIRIVEVLKRHGETVAMTGDGVNDAPALKGADIGVALGSGTDVAKETSDMVLLDDAFSTIVSAIAEGRRMYQNIQKVVLYLVSGSFAEVVMITGSILAGFPVSALPTQILWVNLIEGSFPNIALAFDKGDRENMSDPPRKKHAPLINSEMRSVIIMKSILANVLLFAIFVYFWKSTQNIALTRTIVFVGFAIDSLFYIFSIRSLRKHVWQMNPFDNTYLVGAVLFGWAMLLCAVYLPPLQYLLHTVPLQPWHWALMIGFGLSNMVIIESVKSFFFIKQLHRTIR